MSGDSKNIYVITCGGCDQFYIGETGTTLRTRIRIHKHQIQVLEYQKIKVHVSKHLDTCDHGKFKVCATTENLKCSHFTNCKLTA
jgi:hypothetical protein